MPENDLTQVVLGSGDFYIMPFEGEIPIDTLIELEDNLAGRIKGGAQLEYKPTTKTVKDDSGKLNKQYIIGEDATLKTGVLTWCAATLNKLNSGGRYTDTIKGDKKVRTLQIGGRAGRALDKYLLRFVHEKEGGYKFRCTIVGTASSGFKLEYKPEDATVVDAEFTATAHDDENTLIILEEEYGTITSVLRDLTVTSVAGSAVGYTVVTIAPALASGCIYKYKVALNPTLPVYDQVCTSGWTNWDGVAEIPATDGQTIVVAEVTEVGSYARGVGSAAVVVAAE